MFKIGYSVSLIKVDFPLPETPVIAIIRPNGNSTFIFLRLFPLHPFKISLVSDFLLCFGIFIFSLLFKKFEVTVELFKIFL